MFGTMIEYVLTTFSNHHAQEVPIKHDGSMHTFKKSFHVTDQNKLDDWAQKRITTVIYPFNQQHLPDIIDLFSNTVHSWHTDRKVLVHASNTKWAEINMLFQYHKIALDLGLTTIFQGNDTGVLQRWDKSYTDWKDLRPWQWREWFSLFYPEWIQEWIHAPEHVDQSWLCITNQAILENIADTLDTISKHCDISLVRDISWFCTQYQNCQKYILDQYDVVQSILTSVINQQDLSWRPLNIIAESILQHHFREHGYEWRCDGLDQLPCSSLEFQKIIYHT